MNTLIYLEKSASVLGLMQHFSNQYKHMTKQHFLFVCFFVLFFYAVPAVGQVVTGTAFKDGLPYEPSYAHLPYANPHAKKGGVLSMPVVGSFDSLNPFIDKGVAAAGSFYLYDTLLAGSLDAVNVSYGQLANSMSYDTKNPSWATYTLNPNARFWDGTPVTAHDVKATFEAILSDGLVAWRSYLADIERIEVLNDGVVKFYFKTADNKNAPFLVGQMPIFSKKSIETQFKVAGFTPLMGSGAYRVGQINKGRRIRYERDPNYWGKDVLVNVGRFNFDVLEYRYYGSEDMAFLGFVAGEYEYRVEDKPRRWAVGYDFIKNPHRLGEPIIKQHFLLNNPIATKALVMNTRRPLFFDVRARQAFALAYDFEWTNRTLFYGQMQRLDSYFTGSPLAAMGVPSQNEREILEGLPLLAYEKNALLAPPKPMAYDRSGYHRPSLLLARQLLLSAGFFYRQGRLYLPDGTPATLDIMVANDSENKVLLAYADHLKRLGVAVEIVQVDASRYQKLKREFDFEVIVETIYQGSSPAIEQSYLWGSQAADTEGSLNTAGIKSPAVDAVIQALVEADTHEKTVLYARVLDRLLRSGVYHVPLYGTGEVWAAYRSHYKHPAYLPRHAVAMDYWWQE